MRSVNTPKTHIEMAAPMVQTMVELKQVMGWGVNEVCQWLQTINCPDACAMFGQHSVMGAQLPLITFAHLSYMLVPLGSALRIMSACETLAREKKQADDRETIRLRNRVVKEMGHFYGNCHFPMFQVI